MIFGYGGYSSGFPVGRSPAPFITIPSETSKCPERLRGQEVRKHAGAWRWNRYCPWRRF